MASSFPVGQGYTAAQWESYFQAFTQANPKMATYTGTNAAAKGKNWEQVYAVLYAQGQAQNPKATPDQVAEATLELAQIQGIASGVGSVVTTVGNLPQTAVNSVTQGAAQAASSIPGVSETEAIENFLALLSAKNTWIRVAKIVIGGAMILIGLSHITGADNAIASAARKVPVIV